MLWILLTLLRPAFAQADFAEEAHARMKLSFDLDAAEAMIDAPAPLRAPVSLLPLESSSEVDAVTVFRDRALVTRVLRERLPAGAASLTFEGLPPGLDGGSLHATVRGGTAEIDGVELISGLDLARDSARREELRARMRPMAQELGQVRDRIEALLARRAYLRATLLTPPSGDRPLPSSPSSMASSSLTWPGTCQVRRRAHHRRAQQQPWRPPASAGAPGLAGAPGHA